MLGTARAWAQQVERCCANALDFVEPHIDDRETKEMLSRLNTAQHPSTGCSNALNLLSSTC